MKRQKLSRRCHPASLGVDVRTIGLIAGVLLFGVALAGTEVPRVVAHRGNYQYDDNARGGFEQSLAAGVTGFETDVQMTSDGGFVIMHDATVATTTTGTGNVIDLTFAAVTNLTLKKSGEHVPSLQQITDLFKDRNDVFVEFEMKSQGLSGDRLDQYVDGVYEIVSFTMPAGTYVFTSFDTSYLQAMKTRHATARTAYILGTAYTDVSDASLAPITKAVGIGCSQISPLVGTCAEWIAAAKKEGLNVALWMVEDISTWATCRTKGADTVTSNHPLELYPAATNYMKALEVQGVGWPGQRYFTNDIPWRIDSVLEGPEGLGKWGEGEVVYSGKSTFTGDVLIMGGVNLLTTPDNDVVNTQVGALGNPRVARTVVVSNATLRMVGKNSFGGSGRSTTPVKTDLKFYNSTLDLTTNFAFNAGNVYLHDSVVKFHGGLSHWGRCDVVSGPWGDSFWGSLYVNNLYFSGTKAVTFKNETTNLSNGDYRKAAVSIGKYNAEGKVDYSYQGEIHVPDMTGSSASDVIFQVPLIWTSKDNGVPSGFRKTGAGTLEFATADDNNTARYSSYTGNVDIVEGTWKVSANYVSTDMARTSPFGAVCYPHTFTIHPGATLHVANDDVMGQFYAQSLNTLHVKGGTYLQNGGTVNGLCKTIFENATISLSDAKWNDDNYWQIVSETETNHLPSVQWPSVGFNGGVTFTGTNVYNLANWNTTYYFGCENGLSPTDLELDDISGDDGDDLTINGRLVDAPPWYDRSWPLDAFGRRYVTRLRHVGQPLNVRKTGTGTLQLKNTGSACTGRIEIAEGVLKVAVRGNDDRTATQSALGDLSDSNRVALVLSGGTLHLPNSDTFGQAACVNEARFVVSNGTIRSPWNPDLSKNCGCANSLPYLDLYDANLEYNGGLASGNANAPYGTFIFTHRVRWDGTRPYDLQPNGRANFFCLGHEQDEYQVVNGATTNLHGKVEFYVADITKDADVDVTLGVTLKTQATWGGAHKWGKTVFNNGLLKTGPGTLRLNGNGRAEGYTDKSYYYTEATRVNGGTLLVDTTAFNSTNVFVQSGAYVGGTGTVKRVTIEAGGGFTAAPGQTRPLTAEAVEVLADGDVRLDIPYVGDLAELRHLRVPVVSAAGLEGAKWKTTINGAAAPAGYTTSAVVSGGVVYGVYAKGGLVVIIR